jgi:hypothetical protein
MVLQHQQTSRSDVVKHPIPMAYAIVRLQRSIDPSYQLIALRMMHKLAAESGVQWGLSPDDVTEMMIPPELQFIASKLLAGQSLDAQEEALLARQYLHQSANWNFGPSHYLQK